MRLRIGSSSSLCAPYTPMRWGGQASVAGGGRAQLGEAGRALVGVGHAQDGRLVEGSTDDLQADGQVTATQIALLPADQWLSACVAP